MRSAAFAVLCCASIVWWAGCAPEGGVKAGTGGKSGGGGARGSGGLTGSGGRTGSGGVTGSGGAIGAGGGTGTGGDTGGGGAVGTGGDTVGAGGAGGMPPFVPACNITHAVNSVYPASAANNAPLIADFSLTSPANTSFGDYTDQVSGYSYLFPAQPASGAGAAGGGAGGAGGGAGGAGGGAGGAGGGAGGAGGGVGGAGGSVGAGGASIGPAGLTQDWTNQNWHITGTVVPNTATAFVIQFACPIDASAYAGVQFRIGGNAGPANSLTLQASFVGDEPLTLGTCVGATCRAPTAVVNVPATAAIVQLPWSSFTGGAPLGPLNPAELVLLRWAWTNRAQPYGVNITLDDLQFYSAPVDAGTTD